MDRFNGFDAAYQRIEKTAIQTWVRDFGGVGKVADKLGVTDVAVRNWVKRRGWPKVDIILKLIKLSKGELTFDNIVASSRPRSNRK